MEIDIDHVISRSIASLPGVGRLATATRHAAGYEEVNRLAKELEKELTITLERELESNGKRALQMVLRNSRTMYKLK